MISQRDAFFNRLFQLAKIDRNIVLVSADMGAPSLDQWRLELPSQYINTGVAEQNAINLSTGLALSGFRPFVYAIAPFVSLRVVEQLKIGPVIHSLPVTVVGIGAGLSYADAGPTHHNLEDLRIISSLPNIGIITCTDSAMAAVLPDLCIERTHPTYIRLDRDSASVLYPFITKEDMTWSYPVKKNNNLNRFVVSCGNLFQSVHKICCDKGINCVDVFSVPILDSLGSQLGENAELLVVEEGIGLCTALLEFANRSGISWKITKRDIPCYEFSYGGRNVMREQYGIGKQTLPVTITEWYNGTLS